MTETARLARKLLLGLLQKTQAPHLGSSLSMIDILDAIILRTLNKNEAGLSKDNIVISKGHAAAGLYSTLYAHGQLTEEQFNSFYDDGSDFYGHVSHKATSWVSLTTGSLGHGLPFSIGLALSDRYKGDDTRESIVLMSDGECDEGSIWESALIAAHHNLKNLVVIIDRNGLQSLTTTEKTLALEPLDKKWQSFGWDVTIVDGHSYRAVIDALNSKRSKPLCVIANTTKGKGVSFMENQVVWHYRPPDQEDYLNALAELDN
jgi:transketolase